MLVPLDLCKTTLQRTGFEAKFQMLHLGFRNCETQLDTSNLLSKVFLLLWEFWIPLDCMLVRSGCELWLK